MDTTRVKGFTIQLKEQYTFTTQQMDTTKVKQLPIQPKEKHT